MGESSRSPSQQHLTQIREQLTEYFSLNDLRSLCFDIEIDPERLSGSENKEALARNIVIEMKRRKEINRLARECRERRPKLQWPLSEPEGESVLPAPSKPVSRVCFVSSEYPPHIVGGLGVHVAQLTRALGEHIDVDVVLPTPPGGTDYDPPGGRVHLHPLATSKPDYSRPLSWLSFASLAADRIELIARESRPDVIHCHDWVTVLAGIRCRQRLGIPLVVHLHLPNLDQLCAPIENLGLVCADLVTVNSHAMREELAHRGLPLRRVEIVKNGVDTDLFRPSRDWPADDGYILFVGRLVEQKGVEYLIRALRFVRERFPDARAKIVGEGEFKPKLERLCANLLLSDRVEFLGKLTGDALAECYRKAGVLAVPSVYEPFGMTALEAMACRRPVVASEVGGLRETIQHNRTGFLAQPRDDLDLAQWLMTLLADPKLRADFGTNGLDRVLHEGYVWPEIAPRFLRWYEELRGRKLSKKIPGEAAALKQQVIKAVEDMKGSRWDADRVFEGVFKP